MNDEEIDRSSMPSYRSGRTQIRTTVLVSDKKGTSIDRQCNFMEFVKSSVAGTDIRPAV